MAHCRLRNAVRDFRLARVDEAVLREERFERPAESRAGIAEFPKQIRRAHPWLNKVEARVRETLSEKPILLLFGMKDPFFSRDSVVKTWQANFPQADPIRFETAGHYIQKDDPDSIAQAIRDKFGAG